MARTIHTKQERAAQFIKAGLKIARKNGIAKTSVAAVAAECKVTAPLIFHNFGSREKFQAALADAAKKQGIALPADAAPAPKRKRSIAEVKAIKDKAAGKRAAPKVAKKAVKAPKAVKAAKKPKAVKKAVEPKATKRARQPRAVAAVEQPSVSGAFARMPAPSGVDSNLASKP